MGDILIKIYPWKDDFSSKNKFRKYYICSITLHVIL